MAIRDTSYALFRRKTGGTWSTPSAGAEIVSDVKLSDGNPGVETSVRWPSGSPTTGQYLALRYDWPVATVMLGAYLLGLAFEGGPSIPAGVPVRAYGRRAGDPGYAYALGGNSATAATSEAQDGTTRALLAFDTGLTALVGIEIRIYNDDDGDTWADADTYLRIGEADVAEGVPVRIQYEWASPLIVKTRRERTMASQSHEVERVNYRALLFKLAPEDIDAVRIGGMPGGWDWERIEAILSRAGGRLMLYAEMRDYDGAFVQSRLDASAIYGEYTPDPIVPFALDAQEAGGRVDEVPPLVY